MVFISHSSKDYEALKEWVEFIEELGLKCWISERDLPESVGLWADPIVSAIEESDKIFLYLTRDSVASGPVLSEVAIASTKGKCIIPVLAEKEKSLKIPNGLDFFIRKYEWVDAYRYDDVSALRSVIRDRLFENENDSRKEFLAVINSPEYKVFLRRVLERYYGRELFTEINGEEYPVYCVRAAGAGIATKIKDFDSFCDYDGSELSGFDVDEHRGYKSLKWYKEYSKILDGLIRYPDRPGYMLDDFSLDGKGRFEKIRVHLGTYAENVFSTHVLEYEAYRAFLEFGKSDLDDPETWKRLREFLEIRNGFHGNVDSDNAAVRAEQMKRSLLSGRGKNALLSVQMIVIIKSDRSHRYEVKFIQRSDKVAVKPGVYQLIPAGGFEILNDSDDDIYDDIELEENFSPGCAIFREYIEELFNVPEFEGGGEGSIEDRLLKDPRIVDIEKMLSDGTAEFLFLGSVVSLEGLRHELCFAFVVHDEDYSKNRFIANDECKKGKVNSVSIRDFPSERTVWEKLHEPSAALWELFTETDLYRRLLSSEET